METEKPIAAVPMYKASLIQPAHNAKKRELSTQPTWVLVSQGNFLDLLKPTWLQRMIAVEDARCERRIPEKRPVRKLANFVRRNDPDHLEK